MMQRFKQGLKNDLIAGLLVVIPLATTIWLTVTIANWVINFLTRIPKQINPFDNLNPLLMNLVNLLLGLTVPLSFILLTGLMARNFAGRWLLDVGEQILQAIPLAGPVYKTLKQLLETILKDSSGKFRKVVLVEYPRSGIWAIAFVTGVLSSEVASHMSQPMLSIFVPTTPNPTTGWYAIVPESDVINLDMPIEDAFKIVISGGIVSSSVPQLSLGSSSNASNNVPNDAKPKIDPPVENNSSYNPKPLAIEPPLQTVPLED
ncbi:MAG: DUF502 domain-containing protein [Coleofasciculaceae cyanobacterium SM2_1_6]|nr:DUF502 domain-containing protein [Coleofasciculaceae cyanobacterium SM2_1_6]